MAEGPLGWLWGVWGMLTRALAWPVQVLAGASSEGENQKDSTGYAIEARGTPNTQDFRVFFTGPGGKVISPWHDIPLWADKEKQILNMVVEIPRWSNAKMEISTKDKLNPIKQDVKNGNLRFVKNVFPHKGYIWNYGALPQTYEDPRFVHEDTGAKGDGDPVDVCEIGEKVHARGAVIQVKVLGVIALLDEGETDWKMLAIDVTDPLAAELNGVADVEKHFPGFIAKSVDWFRYYKVPDGKPVNKFAFNGEAKDQKYAMDVVEETHEEKKGWKGLKHGPDSPSLDHTTGSLTDQSPISASDARKTVDEAPPPVAAGPPLAPEVDRWHYVDTTRN